MKIRKNFIACFIAGVFALSVMALPVTADNHNKRDKKKARADIVNTAVSAGNFTTLAKALEAAGLIETLRGAGPYTVFAPTDEAFARLPAGTLDSLMQDRERLRRVLLYHVVPGKLKAKNVVAQNKLRTAQGATNRVSISDGGVRINDANVVKTDIMATNGVIHVIDRVLIPAE